MKERRNSKEIKSSTENKVKLLKNTEELPLMYGEDLIEFTNLYVNLSSMISSDAVT